MYLKKRYIVAILMGLNLIGSAHAEQAPFSTNSQASYLTQVNVAEQEQLATHNFDFNNGQHKPSFEQVESADEGDFRVNLAMNLGSQKRDELNLRVGAISLEFPENSNKPLEVDVSPFIYVGIGSRW